MSQQKGSLVTEQGLLATSQTTKYINRDLSWLKFNERVLNQATDKNKVILERLKFLAITASNLDEFCMIRLGRLYNHTDYKRKRIGDFELQKLPFKHKLLTEIKAFVRKQQTYYIKTLHPLLFQAGCSIVKDLDQLSKQDQENIQRYFKQALFPILTPMVVDSHHVFPKLMNRALVFGVVTQESTHQKDSRKHSFIQIPQNLARFYEIHQDGHIIFVPIEEIIRNNLGLLFKHVTIVSATLLRITRNGDFSVEESDDMETNFLKALERKLKKLKSSRVVRIEIESKYDPGMVKLLRLRWHIDQDNIFSIPKKSLLDFTGLLQITDHDELKEQGPIQPHATPPLNYPADSSSDIFEVLKQQDILLHHPYNNMDLVIHLIEKAAVDPHVLAIKMTIYRLSRDSAITAALLRAVENGKQVSVLFEIRARFDEEHNIQEAKKLEKAGCFVIYGMSHVKTHAKMLMIVRSIQQQVTCYVHLSSGNYNEDTVKRYVDISLMTTDEVYVYDVAEFFNVITGHSFPVSYKNLITAPLDIRAHLTNLIRQEAENARQGLPAGIVIKVNSLEDEGMIDELYQASQAGVPIQLIIRGICCLIPGKPGMSENITVCSIIGNFLEHARIYYFHHQAKPKVYVGSMDMMVSSFYGRIEALFMIQAPILKQQVISILLFNLKDNINSYLMQSDGNYVKKEICKEEPFNLHQELFKVSIEDIQKAQLFD